MNIKYKLTGQAAAVLVDQDKEAHLSTRQPRVEVDWNGFEGDKHSGLTLRAGGRMPHYARGAEIRNDRQVSIVSVEELARIAAALEVPEILPEWLEANLMLQGIPNLTQLPPSTRLFFAQGVTLVVAQANLPCTGPGKMIQAHYGRPELEAAFPRAATDRRGVVAYVEKPGLIAEGDEVQVEVPEQIAYSLEETQ
jgi:hypothetical protein